MREKFNIIPTINYHPQKEKEVEKQINNLNITFPYLAIRVEVFEEKTIEYIKNILSFCGNFLFKIILILDGKFISVNDEKKKNSFKTEVQKIVKSTQTNNYFPTIICAFSSFPKSVIEYGEDSEGEFELIEHKTNQEIISSLNNNKIYHGDYGTIHPVRYDTGGGGWIPRIDVPLDNECFYYRYRRDDGSYARCAKKIMDDSRYKAIEDVNAWGDEEIKYAAWVNLEAEAPLTGYLLELIYI